MGPTASLLVLRCAVFGVLLSEFQFESALPVLTIAIPTVNRLSLLKRALASALAQTAPVEIILSDNGSTDGTETYLASLDCPANLRLFRHTRTMPVQRHGAFLLAQARTEWVVFLSDDDYLERGFAAGVLKAIQRTPDVALVYTGCDMVFGDVAVPAKIGPASEAAADFFYEFMNGNRNICMCATAFRVDDRRSIGHQPDSCLIGDMYYWTRILARGGMVACAGERLSNYSFYRPGLATETNRISVMAWSRESMQLAALMCEYIYSAPGFSWSRVEVERARAKFLALTTSNQFVWNALRGASKLDLARSFALLARLVFRDVSAPARAMAALMLPRSLLERLLLALARRRAIAGR